MTEYGATLDLTDVRDLPLTVGTSRGRDTYGYTTVSLLDTATGKRYRCNGGGYDMTGTVLADWLEDVHQDALQAIADQAAYDYRTKVRNDGGLYGMHVGGSGRVHVDGACGMSSVERIAKAIGVRISHRVGPRGRTLGFLATPASSVTL